jgi:hypothetical protein
MDFATVKGCNCKLRVAPNCVSGHTRSVRRHDRDVVRPADSDRRGYPVREDADHRLAETPRRSNIVAGTAWGARAFSDKQSEQSVASKRSRHVEQSRAASPNLVVQSIFGRTPCAM